MGNTKITFLGTGTSQGVPVIGCKCPVCLSDDTRDKRLRSSILVELPHGSFVIDTGPDFRQQMLRENVTQLDAVLFTHEHKDHVAGMDDIRAFNFLSKKPMEVYASIPVQKALKREFHYVFDRASYPGVPSVNLNTVNHEPFKLFGETITPIEVMHYKMPVFGFRIRDFAYITDAKTIGEREKAKLKGLDVLVINALRKEPHISHLTLDEAMSLIAEIEPKKAYLTHISHYLGKHKEESENLPHNVSIAHDGLKLSF